MSVMLLDLETTGLEPSVDRITELGFMVTSEDFKQTIDQYNMLVWDESYPPTPPQVTEVTGITDEMLRLGGESPVHMLNAIEASAKIHGVEYIIAYNMQFDRGFLLAECIRQNYSPVQEVGAEFLCAMVDVKSNQKYKSWKLMHLALDYGVPVDPGLLHRAINDVELMRQMLIASKVTIGEMVAYHNSPSVYLRAMVKKPWEDGGVSTELAKKHGFSWEKCRGDSRVFDKCWVKSMKEIDLKTEGNFPFETKQIGVKQ